MPAVQSSARQIAANMSAIAARDDVDSGQEMLDGDVTLVGDDDQQEAGGDEGHEERGTDSIFDVVGRQDSDSNGSHSDLSEVENDPRLAQPAISVFGDLPPSASDEVAWALVESVLPAFESARQQYWAGLEGPYILDGEWTLEAYEAFATTLETKWRPAYQDRRIMLFGDPNTVHESLIGVLTRELHLVEWGAHPETPSDLRGQRGHIHLFRDLYSSTCKWQLTPTSISPHCKEADLLIRAQTATTKENGLAVEIAHLNESFQWLCREVQDWTSGDGERALLAVGLKVDTKSPYQRDPRLRLVVRDVSPGSTSLNCRVYEFGHGSQVVPRRAPRFGPPTAVRVLAHTDGEGCLVEHVEPVDPQAEDMLVQFPIGAALFSDLVPDAFVGELGFTLTDAYVEDLKAKLWTLDLGYLRYVLVDKIIKKDVSGL